MIDFKLSPKTLTTMTVDELKKEKATVREYLVYLQIPLKKAQAHLQELYRINEMLVEKKLQIEKILIPTKVIPMQKVTKKTVILDAFYGMSQEDVDKLVKDFRESKNA